ncbi:MAG: Leucine-rich repeat (LRR) protein, partial [Marivirga sp.]
MKKLCFLFILFSFLLFSSLLVLGQCPVENSYSYGTNGEAEFSHTYFEGQTATVFAVGYFETEITLGGIGYTTTNAGEVGKYIAKLDTLGNLLESWQVSAGENIVDGGKNQRGYFDPGVLLTSSEIYIPSTYQSADSSFNYVIESYDHSGNLIWAKIFNGGVNEYGNFGFDEIDMDSSGNLILTGVFHDIISYFDQVPVDLGTNGQTTAFIMSINSIDGFLDIFVPIESAGNMELFGLETDENGGVYVSGNSYGATDLNINGNVSNYSGSNSGFIFKMSLEYASDSATLDWINVFSSDLGIEIKALKYEFDSNGSRIHYAAVDYPDRNDSLIVDTKVGALNVNSGAVLWEHEMAVNGWYYLSYSSWLDPLSQAIYYPTWIKSGAQFVTDLYMDGSLLEDSISSLVVIHKFNTVDGASQLISPTVYSFIGDVAVLPSGKVLAQSNYTSAGDNVTLGALNPASYPFFYGYINNSGTNIAPEAILEASTSSGAGVVSYQWYRDGNVLGGATDSIYIPTTAGIYQAEITDAVGCNFKTKSINIIEAGNTLTDSLALVDLYNATNPGDTAWANNSGWLSAPLVQWYGVNLDANGRVNNLDLNNNNLSGVLPQSLSNLDSLEFFFFYANPNLEGDLFSVLKNYRILKRVSAHDCAFTGIIDPAVFKPGLLEIRVFNNVFTGGIPDEIGLATDLEQFNLEGNSLTGSIPISVGALGNMMEFNLSRNGITGIIPIEIGQMESLQFLNLRECSLSGEVPAEILNVSSLIELFIETNNFSGTLPDMLNMPNFRSLAAGNNPNLLVALPDNLGELTQMEILSFWNTRPNGGVFPEGLYNLTNLSSLDLSDQRFTGIIDSRIGNLINLQALYLRNNNLSGDLPAEITSLTNLDTFDVGRNFFTSVPDLSAFPNLQFLRLSNNYFQMEDLQPYTQLGLSFFGYAPQRRIGVNEDLTPTAGTSFTISTAITDFAGTNYQWLFNRDTLSSATALDLTISDFRTFNAGAYVLQAAHPDLPDLVLFSAFYNVKADIGKTKWFVDNDEN